MVQVAESRGVRRSVVLALIAASVTSFPVLPQNERMAGDLLHVEVIRQKPIDLSIANEEIRKAYLEQKEWVSDVMQVASRSLKPEIARESIWLLRGSGERPDRYHMIVVTDGIPDDSVRGIRYEAVIARSSESFWLVSEATLSWRCWRGPLNAFDTRPCS